MRIILLTFLCLCAVNAQAASFRVQNATHATVTFNVLGEEPGNLYVIETRQIASGVEVFANNDGMVAFEAQSGDGSFTGYVTPSEGQRLVLLDLANGYYELEDEEVADPVQFLQLGMAFAWGVVAVALSIRGVALLKRPVVET